MSEDSIEQGIYQSLESLLSEAQEQEQLGNTEGARSDYRNIIETAREQTKDATNLDWETLIGKAEAGLNRLDEQQYHGVAVLLNQAKEQELRGNTEAARSIYLKVIEIAGKQTKATPNLDWEMLIGKAKAGLSQLTPRRPIRQGILLLGFLILFGLLLTGVSKLVPSILATATPTSTSTSTRTATTTATPSATPSPTMTPTPTSTPTNSPSPTATPTATDTPVVVPPSCTVLLTGPNNTPTIVQPLNLQIIATGPVSTRVSWNNISIVPGGCPAGDVTPRRFRLVDVERPFSLGMSNRSDIRLTPQSGNLRLEVTLQLPAASSQGSAIFKLEMRSQSVAGAEVWTPIEPLRLQLDWKTVFMTPTPEPTNTPIPTRTPTPTFTPTYPAPMLNSPEDGLTAQARTTFTWNWSGPPLTANQGFEVRLWKEGQPDHPGIAAPVRTTSLVVNFSEAHGTGRHFWTVAVVQISPYKRIAAEAPPRTLIIADVPPAPP